MDEYPKVVNGWVVPDRETEDAFVAGEIEPPVYGSPEFPHSANPQPPPIPSVAGRPHVKPAPHHAPVVHHEPPAAKKKVSRVR